ncbi:hypothetical protein KC878_01245, partial [Candidatus Saccharibacteria bacterium]|nr:hypothetical protein [Candidatus Saccharibacteria bacterium]
LAFVLSLITTLTLSIITYDFRYQIGDWYRLRGYQPGSEIVDLADKASLNDYGRKLFYVNHPELLTADEFNLHCPEKEKSVVLGCYNGTNIYLYNVDATELSDVKQITAAHEMLHAAYARLSGDEKQSVNDWLKVAEANIVNSRITQIIKSYGDLSDEARFNELHSIIGTEVANLPSFLEDYYSKYFVDRSEVVAASQRYEGVFLKLEKQIAQYDEQLVSLSLNIRSVEATIENQVEVLDQKRQKLDLFYASEEYGKYNDSVPEYNRLVEIYNQAVENLKQLISDYNDIVNARNLLGVQQNNLAQSLDSHYKSLETK